MPPSEPPDSRLSPTEVDAQLRGLSGADWERARSLARFCAAGLTGWTPDNLLAEALVKLQSGERVWRPGVHPLVTLKTAMRSIASNNRKKEARGPIDHNVAVNNGYSTDENVASLSVQGEDAVTPEDIADGRSQLAYIEDLMVGSDEDVQMVLMAWVDKLRGKEAAEELGFDMHRYEAARKRLLTRLKPAAELRKRA